MSDTTTPDAPSSEESALAPELPPHLLALRDHVLGAFPDLDVNGHLGELTFRVGADDLPRVLAFCKEDPDVSCEVLADIGAVHWPAGVKVTDEQESTTGWPQQAEATDTGHIQVDYILRSVTKGHWFRVQADTPDDAPVLPSATPHYSSANFLEREVYDLMGVEFTGHPALTRIMMPEDWDGHPHRKDYPLGGVEVMYKGKTVPPPDERDY